MSRRDRAPWAHVAPAMQASYLAARDDHVGQAATTTLHAIHYLLGLHQRLTDQISTSQLAKETGLWDGTGPCPPTARATIGRHLNRLADARAITYTPAQGRGTTGRVSLPDADPLPGCTCTDCKTKVADSTRPSDTKPAHQTRRSDRNIANGPRPSAANIADDTRPSRQKSRESTPRKVANDPLEKSRATRDHPRVKTPRSLPEGSHGSGTTPLHGGVASAGERTNGAGAAGTDPPAAGHPVDPDGPAPAWMGALWALAPDDMSHDRHVLRLIDALRAAPWDYLAAIPDWFTDTPPADLAHATSILTTEAARMNLDLRLPKGPRR